MIKPEPSQLFQIKKEPLPPQWKNPKDCSPVKIKKELPKSTKKESNTLLEPEEKPPKKGTLTNYFKPISKESKTEPQNNTSKRKQDSTETSSQKKN